MFYYGYKFTVLSTLFICYHLEVSFPSVQKQLMFEEWNLFPLLFDVCGLFSLSFPASDLFFQFRQRIKTSTADFSITFFFVSGLFFPPPFHFRISSGKIKLVQLSPGQLEILISVISSVFARVHFMVISRSINSEAHSLARAEIYTGTELVIMQYFSPMINE